MMRRFAVGDRIPAVLTKQEIADGLGYSPRQIETFRRARNHPAIKALEAPGHPRFDGRAVEQWLSAGAPEPRRVFFGSARRGA